METGTHKAITNRYKEALKDIVKELKERNAWNKYHFDMAAEDMYRGHGDEGTFEFENGTYGATRTMLIFIKDVCSAYDISIEELEGS